MQHILPLKASSFAIISGRLQLTFGLSAISSVEDIVGFMEPLPPLLPWILLLNIIEYRITTRKMRTTII